MNWQSMEHGFDTVESRWSNVYYRLTLFILYVDIHSRKEGLTVYIEG